MIRHFENITVNYPPTLRDEWVSRSNNMKIFKDQPVWVQKMIERRVLDTGRDVSSIDPEDSISVLFIMRDTPEGHYAWVGADKGNYKKLMESVERQGGILAVLGKEYDYNHYSVAVGSQNVAAPLMVRKSNADRLAEILNIKKESFYDGSSHWVILKFDKHEVEIVFDENGENVTGITLSKSKREKIISRLK